MRRGYADTASGQVHYITEGDGDALVLLHQAPLSAKTYLNLIPELSPKFQRHRRRHARLRQLRPASR